MKAKEVLGVCVLGLLVAACPGPKKGTASTAASTADATATAAPPVESATATATAAAPTAASATPLPTASAAAGVVSSCPFWNGVTSLEASTMAGRGDFFAEYKYDFATGMVEVNDSDPFANGKEAKTPRVTKTSKQLKGDDKARLEKALTGSCPKGDELKRACAPGGCSRLRVKTAAGESKIEDVPTVHNALSLLRKLFPELRQM